MPVDNTAAILDFLKWLVPILFAGFAMLKSTGIAREVENMKIENSRLISDRDIAKVDQNAKDTEHQRQLTEHDRRIADTNAAVNKLKDDKITELTQALLAMTAKVNVITAAPIPVVIAAPSPIPVVMAETPITEVTLHTAPLDELPKASGE